MKKFEVLSISCYKNFFCKANDCQKNCCKGWTIPLNKEEYKKIKEKKENIENFISPNNTEHKNSKINRQYTMLLDEKGTCPFLDEQGLCSLQLKHGIDILPNICMEFPRRYDNYMNQLEWSLSLGCERVLELLSGEHGHLTFSKYTENLSEQKPCANIITKKDLLKYPVLNYYYEIQDLCISLLQAEDVSLENRLLLIGIALKRIDELVQKKEAYKIPSYIEKYFLQLETMDLEEEINTISVENIAVLYNNLLMSKVYLSKLDTDYVKLFDKIMEKLQAEVTVIPSEIDSQFEVEFNCLKDVYDKCKKNFEDFMKDKEYFLENILVGWLWFNKIPFYNLENGVWKDYTYFIWAYSMLKMVLTIAMDENSSIKDMIQYCVIIFRQLGHNKLLYQTVIRQFEEHDTNSVAHMAIFLKA